MPFTEIVASVDQDQAAQNMQPDLNSTLSVTLEHYRQKIAKNVPLCLCYCGIRISILILVINICYGSAINPFPNIPF